MSVQLHLELQKSIKINPTKRITMTAFYLFCFLSFFSKLSTPLYHCKIVKKKKSVPSHQEEVVVRSSIFVIQQCFRISKSSFIL